MRCLSKYRNAKVSIANFKAPDELSFSSVYTLFANKQLLFTVAKNHKATLFIKISVYFPFLFTLVNTQVHNLFEASTDRWFNSGL